MDDTMMKAECANCGADVSYHVGDIWYRCTNCGQELKVVIFEDGYFQIKKTEEENALVKKQLEIAEKEKQTANDRLFTALSNLDSLKSTQKDLRGLLKALKEDTAGGRDSLTNLLRALMAGQKSADDKLHLLSDLSNRLLKSQDDIQERLQTQEEIAQKINELEISAKKRQKLQEDFIIWTKNVRIKDKEKLKQISEASETLLNGQKKLADKVNELNSKSDGIQKQLAQFEGKWEKARLTELHQLFHQGTSFQRDQEFDKAADFYRRVLVKGGDDGEIYWRLLLCHYCVFYQKDDNGNRIPIILNPDLSDPEEMSLRKDLRKHLPEQVFPSYYKELAAIDRILDKYRSLKDEVKYDIFISVKQEIDGFDTDDSNIAVKLHNYLVNQKFRVFNSRITKPPAGEEYEPYIIAALISAKVLIVVGTNTENMNAPWVKNEWSRFQWMQRRESNQREKRRLICYLAGGMKVKQLPRGLSDKRQVIFDSEKAQGELLESLAFLQKTKESPGYENRRNINNSKDTFRKIEAQMTTWLFNKKYEKVQEKYERLTDEGLFLSYPSLHIKALCAEQHVANIQKIVCSELVLENLELFELAIAVCTDPEERKKLDELIEKNRQWRENKKRRKKDTAADMAKAEEWNQLGNKAYNQNNHSEALKWYRKAAETGHAKAQNMLGWYYDTGTDIPVNHEEAVKWYKKAAEQGDPVGQYNYAQCLRSGRGTAKNETEAVMWYSKAAGAGDADAQYMMGWCFENGIGIPENRDEAKIWYQRAADQGQKNAAANLERIIEKEKAEAASRQESPEEWFARGSRAKEDHDYTRAAEWYRKAAEAGNAQAQSELGYFYSEGTGVAKSETEAAGWYRKAAEQGNLMGQNNYAKRLVYGIGIQKNEKEGARWYRKGAEIGNAYAQNGLGTCYEFGLGVPEDLKEARQWYQKSVEQGYRPANKNLERINGKIKEKEKADTGSPEDWYRLGDQARDKSHHAEAIKWYRRAAEAGHSNAQTMLGWYYGTGTGIPLDNSEAVKWFKKSAEQGNPTGQYNYALYLQNGKGVAKNDIEAWWWYQKAADAGNADAQNGVGMCYENGTGVSVDKRTAKKWYQKAAAQGHKPAKANLERMLSEEKAQTASNQEQLNEWYQKGVTAQREGKGKEAMEWFLKAAECGHADAQNAYGSMLLFNGMSNGNQKEAEEGFRWTKKAAEQGNPHGQFCLGMCYENGHGTPVNKEEAIRWYQKASEQGGISARQAKKRLKRLTKKGLFS